MINNIQLCAYGPNGGDDTIKECEAWYDSPKSGRAMAQSLLTMYPHLVAVWVRKINDGHMRTIAFVEKEKQEGK